MYRFRWPDRLALLGAILLLPTAGSAQCMMGQPQGTPLQGKAFKGRSTSIVCPVMGRKVPKSQAVPIAYQGKTYYLCCGMCQSTFNAKPAHYAKKAARYADPIRGKPALPARAKAPAGKGMSGGCCGH